MRTTPRSRRFLAPLLALACLASLAPSAAVARADEPSADEADAQAVTEAAPPGEDSELDGATQRERYEREHLVLLDGGAHARVRRGDLTLSGVDLYRAIGRPDLVADYRTGQAKRLLGGAVGAAIFAVGLYLPLMADKDCSGVPRGMRESCQDAAEKDHTMRLQLGVTGMVAGAGIIVAALLWSTPDPVDRRQLGHMVEHANWRLRRRLGVVDVAVAPTVGADGGGVLFAGSF